jgi:hypothetical protein
MREVAGMLTGKHGVRKGALMLLGLLGVATSALIALPGLAGASPAGSNGTAKTHEGDGLTTPERRQEPKVCTFRVEVFGFDRDQQVSFQVYDKAHGSDHQPVVTDTITTNQQGQGSSTEAYSLPDGRYKLVADSSDGTDKAEHKVFSVRCSGRAAEQQPVPTSTDPMPTSTDPMVALLSAF